ncbi:MAG: 4Fe-4S ferredoxin [Crenarchaeota archaeon]|nr:4Fe-4S ferredoxin [Thermoproteota archaeon]
MIQPWVWSTWVKAPILKSRKLFIVSACLPIVNPKLFEEISRQGTVLLACPEREPATHYGKIASMIRSNEESIEEVVVITIDGSPHCFTLQASVNEAEYILGKKLRKKHYVLVDGRELVEIDPVAIRVARYLHLVDKLVKERRQQVEEELRKHSLEHRKTMEYR